MRQTRASVHVDPRLSVASGGMIASRVNSILRTARVCGAWHAIVMQERRPGGESTATIVTCLASFAFIIDRWLED